ncbi:TIGR01777 family oxidoreductase [Carboxylicivirga marina]|uniref:TIGR01777 family oxidoreductase n=1 Tax=Carboxylicivirga marina TaxID=2800988 RepID=A0ABS1HGR6_9BACT|nr:TIGR01777 family oxidoreductase [Carboxylicivirga marina]MBK3516815.1 TIGR01777 family oxidoreductase [Carboxylicivirga marina]
MPQRLTKYKVAISGATGFIGTALSSFLESNGFDVIRLKRHHFTSKRVGQLNKLLNGCSVIINLAGAPVAAKKWTKAYKHEILNSRIDTTERLVEAIHEMTTKPDVFISTSAVGIYDSYEVHDEFSTNYSNDFLADVCQQWEARAYRAQSLDNVRLCIVRLGVVLGNEGGAFPRMIKPFKLGLGSKLGDGHQVFPYIHINDVLSAFWYLIQRKASHGIYNFVAPQMISNLEITEALQKRTRKSLLPAVPKAALRLLYGEGAELLLTGQKVKPKRLEKDGFHFAFPDIESVLDDLCY